MDSLSSLSSISISREWIGMHLRFVQTCDFDFSTLLHDIKSTVKTQNKPKRNFTKRTTKLPTKKKGGEFPPKKFYMDLIGSTVGLSQTQQNMFRSVPFRLLYFVSSHARQVHAHP